MFSLRRYGIAPIAAMILLQANSSVALDNPPQFEVASVKVTPLGPSSVPEKLSTTPAGVTMQNMRLRVASMWAYHLQSVQISGPEPLDSQRYEIIANAPRPTTEEQLKLMFQELLSSRFKLSVHRTTKDMQVYELAVSKTGLKMKESQQDQESKMVPSSKLGLSATSTGTGQIALFLSRRLQMPVFDVTALTGRYDFTLDLAPYMDREPDPQEVPEIFARAFEEELGLTLKSRKAAVDLLVVDHVEGTPVGN